MKIFYLVNLITFLTLSAANKYDGYKIYEITPKTRSANSLLSEIVKNASKYDVVNEHIIQGQATRIMVSPADQENFIRLLDDAFINYRVYDEDVGITIDRQFEQNRALRSRLPFKGRLGTERYYSQAEINQYIEELAGQYPGRVFVKTVGKSYEGRWLKTITITNGDRRANKNVIFVDGGFHAREWISPAAVIYMIEQLVENYSENADILLDYDWIILPVVNADGYEYTQLTAETRFWRKTRQPIDEKCIGTDPNRNFDFHWNEEGSSPDPCSEIYAGPRAFSEPEALVVGDLLQGLAGRGQFYLTVHSCGSLLLYPWGWINEVPDTVDDLYEVAYTGYKAILEATGTNYTFGCSTEILYPAAGASDDYAFNAGFPISFTMELPCGGLNGFDMPAEKIDATVKETWIGVRAMAKKVVEKYPLKH